MYDELTQVDIQKMRDEIASYLGVEFYDIYGLTEICGPGAAFECLEKHGMHINEDCFLAEIIDPDTLEVLPAGQQLSLIHI